jgi:hypothetical protein
MPRGKKHVKTARTDGPKVAAANRAKGSAKAAAAPAAVPAVPPQQPTAILRIPAGEATRQFLVDHIRDGVGAAVITARRPVRHNVAALAAVMDSPALQPINGELKRSLLTASDAQVKACFPPLIFELAATSGLHITSGGFVVSKPDTGLQKMHRDVSASKDMTAALHAQMVSENLLPTMSAFSSPTGGSLYLCLGSQYAFTGAYRPIDADGVDLEDRLRRDGRRCYVRVEYGPDDVLLINSSLLHFGDASKVRHLRMFCLLEGGPRGVPLSYVDAKGNQVIELIVDPDDAVTKRRKIL